MRLARERNRVANALQAVDADLNNWIVLARAYVKSDTTAVFVGPARIRRNVQPPCTDFRCRLCGRSFPRDSFSDLDPKNDALSLGGGRLVCADDDACMARRAARTTQPTGVQ